MSSARPLPFVVLEGADAIPTTNHECDMCEMYLASVNIAGGRTFLCRDCLRRLRATLKAAEKALPALPKQPRPEWSGAR